MNGNSGIQPTVELATTNGNNGFYPYPVYPMMGGYGNGNGGFFGGDGIWALLLIALLFGNGGWGGFGGFGGFGGGFGMTDGGLLGYAIGNNATKGDVSDGFNSLHLSNQIEGTRDAIHNVSTQLCDGFHNVTSQICNSTANVTNAITNGFYNAEISANNRQMADMQQNFALSTQLANASADNRLGIANLNSTILAENCADREALREVGQSIIVNQNNNTQKIIDEIFRDRLDEKDSKISDLQRELQMADLRASQIAQTANIVDMTYARLRDCPIDSTPIYRKNSDI